MSKTNPEHYDRHALQPFDVIDAWDLDYYRGSALKYICRAGTKPGEDEVDDLKKAIVFLQRRVDKLEGRSLPDRHPGWWPCGCTKDAIVHKDAEKGVMFCTACRSAWDYE